MNQFLLIIGLLIFSFFSCKGLNSQGEDTSENAPSSLTPVNYVQFFENPKNELNLTQTEGLMEYQIQYKSPEYMISKSIETDEISKEFVQKEKKEYGDMEYFTLKIKTNSGEQDILKEGVKNNEQFGGRVEYFSFHMQQDLFLVEENDTIPCTLYHFERTFGIAPYCTVLFGFEKKHKKLNSFQVLYLDRLFSNKVLPFNFKKESLKRIPRLITK